MKLFNTLSRKIEEFEPIKPGEVGIYSCGPTVYWNQHIGHMYAYVQWDSLVRALRYEGFKVKWVMNVTDVGHLTSDEDVGEDKMEKGAKREGLSVWEIADKYIKQFKESMELLNITLPDFLVRATDHIEDQIDLTKRIEKNGFAYKTSTGLVFDTSKFEDYDEFANLDLDEQEAGKRVEVDLEKKKPWDFLLWITNQPEHIMKWDSPWGVGFPGWHIECTAMSTKYLGEQFDIHTGGIEHIPVHHTNEIAQAYGAFGRQTANYWLHNSWLLVEGEKMSKSLGNNILVTDLITKGFDPLVLRYLILNSNYRKGINFTWESLAGAQTALKRLRNKVVAINTDLGEISHEYRQMFLEAVNDDLNMPEALAVLWKLLEDKTIGDDQKLATVLDFDRVLGLKLDLESVVEEVPQEILILSDLRERLRLERKFEESDEVRQKIEKMGYTVKDTPEGSRVVKN